MSLLGRTPNYPFGLIDFDSAPWHDQEYANWRLVDSLFALYIPVTGIVGIWTLGVAYVINNRVIDDTDGTLWNADVANTPLVGTFAAYRAANPTHWTLISGASNAWLDITGKPTTIVGYGITDAYTEAEVNALLASKSDTGHNHDTRYYTETEADAQALAAAAVAQKRNTSHDAAAGGTVDAIVVSYVPQFTSYSVGMMFSWVSDGRNTVTNPTINVSTLGVKTIKKRSGIALDIGDIGAAGYICHALYDGVDVILLNPDDEFRREKFDDVTVKLTSTNADDLVGPELDLDRSSATPVANDVIGGINRKGRTTTGAVHTYVSDQARIVSPTNADEYGEHVFRTSVSGTHGPRMVIGRGIYLNNAVGDDKGIGTANAVALYMDGIQVAKPFRKAATQILNNTSVLTADDSLKFVIDANKTYAFMMEIFYNTLAAADFEFDFDTTASTPPTIIRIAYDALAPAAAESSRLSSVLTAMNVLVSVLGAAGNGHIRVSGRIKNGSDAGTFRLRWSQAIATVGDTSVYEASHGSWAAL